MNSISPKSSIVVLTGAGISAESGLSTFRAQDGLWEQHRIEDVATPKAFRRDPGLVHRFYNERRNSLKTAEPNSAHTALARLESAWEGDFLLVTQNIDDLHERGGSQSVLHMHGELRKIRCNACGTVSPWEGDSDIHSSCPCCQKPGQLRPHVVWFGEMPLEMERIYRALANCGLFVSVGTSGNVYPASRFVERVPSTAHTLEINLEPTQIANAFRENRCGRATELVPDFVEETLKCIQEKA